MNTDNAVITCPCGGRCKIFRLFRHCARSIGTFRQFRYILIALTLATLFTSALAADPPLHRAIHEDRTADAQALLANGADPSAANRYGVTPLVLACTNGNADLVAALLAAGANPDTAGNGGATPLMTAARTGRQAPVRLLLSAGAKVNTRDRSGQTALMWAAVEGHAEVTKLLLSAGADREAALGSGFNAWFFAARQGHAGVIDALLADGVDVNSTIKPKNSASGGGWGSGGKGRAPKNGTSALLFAIENGHFDLATKLLKAGADANDMRSGSTPLHALTWVRKPERGDNIAGAPPPHGSGDMTSLEFAEVLITKHGADVDAQLPGGAALGKVLGRPGATPFLFAARTADLPYMKLLVKHGADPRTPNKQGRTPLLAAAGVVLSPQADEAATEDEAVAAVKYLLDLGAQIDVVDSEGDTVMHAAAYKQSPKLVRLLAGRGANIEIWNTVNRRGWTPLLIAQGFRYGNFKPSAETAAALGEVMRQAGIEPPAAPPPPGTEKKEKYQD